MPQMTVPDQGSRGVSFAGRQLPTRPSGLLGVLLAIVVCLKDIWSIYQVSFWQPQVVLGSTGHESDQVLSGSAFSTVC
eukprot:3361116-Rhodomonas_salina.1